jgi:hypothetical protein
VAKQTYKRNKARLGELEIEREQLRQHVEQYEQANKL